MPLAGMVADIVYESVSNGWDMSTDAGPGQPAQPRSTDVLRIGYRAPRPWRAEISPPYYSSLGSLHSLILL
jgi:hypothetical protein